ncbi:MAG: hypothetical protein AB7O98_16610 [Hyphomonadaceae bacterium]
MRARGSIPASAKVAVVAALALGAGACQQMNPCAVLMQNVEMVRAGEASVRVSDEYRITRGSRRPARVRRGARGDFSLLLDEHGLQGCVPPQWSERVETELRPRWGWPAKVFEREGWPTIVLLEDERRLQLRIERAAP